jgi:hypothetical protein
MGVRSGMESQNKSAGRAYVIEAWWSVEHEFSVEYSVPHWERLIAVKPLSVGGSYGLFANRNEITVRVWGH